ncbi:nuclear receptor-binding factor 2-like [Chelonus insularis]|uniref:nuclear receptor-binding factor 2-like n=1 Tax=Chelonus insularis TaxID=460826 RepID=UPI00158E66FF|nr:nuclear receptor-binding factor 2-like [Chelonus insularis]
MENSILNIAHEKQRKAEAFLHQGRFEDAAECHERVAGLLSEVHNQLGVNFVEITPEQSITSTDKKSPISSIHSIVALESLALQRDYHKRQAAVVRMKQAQYEEYKNTFEVQQKNLHSKHSTKHHDKGFTASIGTEKFEGSLRQAIYKTIEEQDTLLSLISLPDDDQAFKHPKDTGTVIEELRTVNSQLRSLVESLLSQLEAKEQEVKHLTQQLHTVSVVENDEICSGEGRSVRLAPLPPLAPLEMPLFDYTSS